MTGNMDIYEQCRAVPPEAQKEFNNGSFSGTDINPMWRIKKLTELFGPAGIGWYYDVISERSETYGNTVMAIVDINLFVKIDGEWSKPIYGTGGNTLVKETRNGTRPSDEGYKMALTDAISVAAKALGVGADIYFQKDRTKYQKPAEQPAKGPVCAECGKPIVDSKKSDGSIWPASDIAAYSQKGWGKPMCYVCTVKRWRADQKKAKANESASG